MTTSSDPFDTAVEAAESSGKLWGRMEITPQWVTFDNHRKVAWDAGLHSVQARRTEIHMVLNPLDQTGMNRTSERQMLAESKEFAGIVWPSVRALGLADLRSLHGKWAKVELVKTGRTYPSKTGGGEVEVTTFKFLSLFNTEAECVAAYLGERGGGLEQDIPFEPAHSPQMDEKAMLAAFLPTLVKQANGDVAVLAQLIAGMPMLNKHYTVNSPEVLALLAVPA